MRKAFFTTLVFAMISLISQRAEAVTYGTTVLKPSKTFPSVVSVWLDKSKSGDPRESKFICTATLIESNVALTAAHCIQGLRGNWYVAVGADRLGEGRFIPVDAVWYSGRYSVKRIANDIGMLHLETPAGLKKYASVSKVNSVTSKSKLQIVGWGSDQNGDLSGDLNQIKVTLDTRGGRQSFGTEFNERTTIAAGRYLVAERLYGGACNGDSGGPLFIAGTVTIVGTVSKGVKGCDAYAPTVFARVSYYSKDISDGLKLIKKKARESSTVPVVETIPTTTIPTTTIPKTCATGSTCAVGDIGPGGGIVFYVASAFFISPVSSCDTNCLYLEAASQTWGNRGITCGAIGTAAVDPKCAWSGNIGTLLGDAAQGTAIGTGYGNTLAITTQSSGGGTVDRAATSARAYTGGSKTDWFLPSRGELNELCKYARTQTAVDTATVCARSGILRSGFVADYYWSSSESIASSAILQNFGFGTTASTNKNDTYYVRPVRAF